MGRVSERARLILLSFLMLFTELALIRWTGSNVIYLSYFSNFVLLGSFLGIGIGFLRSTSKVQLFPRAAPVLAIFVFFVLMFPVQVDRSGTQIIFFGVEPSGLPIWVMLPIIFVATAAIMAMIADGVARTFATFEPLEAYRLDIIGSILGIGAFSLLSFLGTPPIAWALVVGACFILLSLRRSTLVHGLQLVVAILALVMMLGNESASPQTYWSPYYKVSVSTGSEGTYGVLVNGIPHQTIESIVERRDTEPLYFAPYERAPNNPLNRVLVIGAGTGSDVAIALKEAAKRVDAVEIDPRLYELGKQLNPDHPYQDPRVHVSINDGRAFLQQSDQQYDMILFALPDSLTLVAGQSSLRLESYLLTQQAMQVAKDHLGPGGVFVMYNFYRERWLIDRLAGTLNEVYGHPPCIDTWVVGHFAVLTTSVDPQQVSCRAVWHPMKAAVPPPATDDHPFVYLRTRGIPSIYLLTLALILLVSFLAVRVSSGPLREMKGYVDLFFMGAAFLLLETKNVVQFALLFGTTWFVNALVFAGILLSVLAAIEVARRFSLAHPSRLYVVLAAACTLAWFVSPEWLLSLSIVPRFVAATGIAFAPIFVANLIFAQRFKAVGSSVVAFGANLLGAMIGGLLEYGALVVGYRSLLLVVAGLYTLAFVFRPRESAEARNGEITTAHPEGYVFSDSSP
jgi:SAM-dependent methyltransferase